MAVEVEVSFFLAFVAGLVSFLSPCVLPVVPSCIAFVSGLTLAELETAPAPALRARALLHSSLFMLGFGLVFMTLGLVATTAGMVVARSLPWINRIGGVLMMAFGALLLGLLKIPALERDLRPGLHGGGPSRTGALGSVLAGIAFGAGWTPCIGPILASVLLYASLDATMVEGTLLLATYAVGLGIPFVAASVGLNWFLAGSARVRNWMVPLQRIAGGVLLVIGLAMVSGQFARLTAFLAGLGQLINLEIS
jgi:cytochrome c-type biogenesis protein